MSMNYPPPFSPNWQDPGVEPPRKAGASKLGWIIASIVGVSVVGFVLCCGGGTWLMFFSMGVITAEVENQIRDNPQVKEHVGEIQEFKMDFTRTYAADDDDTFVYLIKGNKASGKVTIKHITNDDGKEEIISASLRLDSGQTVQLVP